MSGVGFRGCSGCVLALLLAVNVFNYLDRSLIGTLAQPIKQDLLLSDTQLSLLAGLSFALAQLACGPFLARLVDRGYRRPLLIGGLVVWSTATIAGAYAQSFPALALARVALGGGEATAFPAAMSLIVDLFRPAQRQRAVAVYQSAGVLAVMAGTALAGAIGESLGWRAVFMLCGSAGLCLAGVLFVGLPDPPRNRHDVHGPEPAVDGFIQAGARLTAVPGFAWAVLGYGLAHLSTAVLSSWAPAFLLRTQAVGLARVGAVLGPAVGLGGVAGALVFGALATELVKRGRNPAAALLAPLIGLPLSAPLFCVFLATSSFPKAVVCVGLANFFLSSASGPIAAVAIGLAPHNLRGSAATLLLLSQSLLAVVLGPLLVGLASDLLAPAIGAEALRYALPSRGEA